MSDFELYFSFYGLLLGLSVAVVIGGLAKALNAESDRGVGLLTLALGLFVLMDITSFWLWAWGQRELVVADLAHMFGGLFIAGTYYFAASLVFPEAEAGWASTDEHYWAKKRRVFAGVLAANIAVFGWAVWSRPPALNDWGFYAWQLGYFGPLTALLLTRRRAIDLALIATLVLYYLVVAGNLLPESHWGAGIPL